MPKGVIASRLPRWRMAEVGQDDAGVCRDGMAALWAGARSGMGGTS